MEPNEIQLVKDVCGMFAKQLPQLVAYCNALELEIDGYKKENDVLRTLINALETQLHEIEVKKSPAESFEDRGQESHGVDKKMDYKEKS